MRTDLGSFPGVRSCIVVFTRSGGKMDVIFVMIGIS